MSQQDRITRKSGTGDGTSGSALDQLTNLRDEVPEIDETLDRAERALRQPVVEEPVIRGCGCWG